MNRKWGIMISMMIPAVIMIAFNCNKKQQQQGFHNDQKILTDSTGATNDFYDNEPVKFLPVASIFVDGEITDPGEVSFSDLPVHSVVVKEILFNGDSASFIGAYRYDGYSLYDILNLKIPEKLNKEEFPPIIDLYVEVSNEVGEKVIFSWGEIYYPVIRHQIIIAGRVTEIVPSKTKDHWPVPETWKLVVTPDLITERNISQPVRISVRSIHKSFPTDKNKKYSPEVNILKDSNPVLTITALPQDVPVMTYPNVFYGRGRGIHSITPFSGILLSAVLSDYFIISQKSLREGLFIISGMDGYRAAFSFSEVMNRNDQSEVLLVDVGEDQEGGRFRLYPGPDFFSDRSVFSLKAIEFVIN